VKLGESRELSNAIEVNHNESQLRHRVERRQRFSLILFSSKNPLSFSLYIFRLKETLQVSPMNSLPQIQIVQNYMNFFSPPNYNHGLNQNTIPPGMLTAQEVMKALMKIFPDAKAHQVPMGNEPRGQWMFRGIERRVRNSE